METNKNTLSLVTMSELNKRISQKPMHEIAKEIEDQLLVRIRETEVLQNMLKECSEYVRNDTHQDLKSKTTQNSCPFPGYPADGDLIEKFEFLEQIHMRMWNKSSMEKLIIQAEGEKASKKTLKNISEKLARFAKCKCRCVIF